jgi:hypothetical protein
MACGCKNKQNEQVQAQPAPAQIQTPQTPTQSVQESVNKVVEKYYKK